MVFSVTLVELVQVVQILKLLVELKKEQVFLVEDQMRVETILKTEKINKEKI